MSTRVTCIVTTNYRYKRTTRMGLLIGVALWLGGCNPVPNECRDPLEHPERTPVYCLRYMTPQAKQDFGQRYAVARQPRSSSPTFTMTRIVTTHYRYKRPPRKRKPVALDIPAIVTAKNSRRPNLEEKAAAEVPRRPQFPERRGQQRNQAHRARQHELLLRCPPTITPSPRSSPLGRRGRRFGDAPDLTPEEHQAARRCRRHAVARTGAPGHRQGAAVVAIQPPQRHWRSDGDDPLPTGKEALDEPFSAFPSLVHADQVRPLR